MGASYEIMAKWQNGKIKYVDCVVNLHKGNGHVFMCFIRDKYEHELKNTVRIGNSFEIQISRQSLMWLEEILIDLKNSESFEDLKENLPLKLPYMFMRKGDLRAWPASWKDDEFTYHDVQWILKGGLKSLYNDVHSALNYMDENPDHDLYFSYVP